MALKGNQVAAAASQLRKQNASDANSADLVGALARMLGWKPRLRTVGALHFAETMSSSDVVVGEMVVRLRRFCLGNRCLLTFIQRSGLSAGARRSG